MNYVADNVSLSSLEEISVEVIDIVDKSVKLAIQDVLCLDYEEHSFEPDLFDELLVQSYNRIYKGTYSPKPLSEEDIRMLYMKLVVPSQPGLYYDRAIKMIQKQGKEVELYHKQMTMFYRRFCRHCYEMLKDIGKRYIAQMIQHKIQINDISEDDLDGATIGYFYDIDDVSHKLSTFLDYMCTIYLYLKFNIHEINPHTKADLKRHMIFGRILRMNENLFRFAYKSKENARYLYKSINYAFKSYSNPRKFDLYLITKDHRVIYLNYDRIDIHDSHMIPKYYSQLVSSNKYHPSIFFLYRFAEIYIIYNNGNHWYHTTLSHQEDVDSIIDNKNIANWRAYEDSVTEVHSITYDGDLMKLFSELSYYYNSNIRYKVVVPDVKELMGDAVAYNLNKDEGDRYDEL